MIAAFLPRLCAFDTRDMGWVGLALQAGLRIRHDGMEETTWIGMGKLAGKPSPVLHEAGMDLQWIPSLEDLTATSWTALPDTKKDQA